jgi:signal transduction histidine kinase
MHRKHFFQSAGPLRSMLEALLMGAVMCSALLLLQGDLSSALQLINALLVGLLCITWCALRLRQPGRPWWRKLLSDVATAFFLSLLLAGMLVFFSMVLPPYTAPNYSLHGNGRIVQLAILTLLLDSAAFVFFRLAIRVLLYWDQLRRKQLLWSLTHAHVMVVALGAALLIVVLEMLFIFITHNYSIVLPSLLFLVALSAIALAIVIPPSAVFSYLVMRRITRRLKSLTAATSALRRGNYAVRIPVVGEDEVAQLQADFNTMATNLEKAMYALQDERDTVAALLQSRRELIANVSHELRTPMATIRGYLETTLAHWDGNPSSSLQNDLQVMEHEAIRLQALVEDLFTLSRAEVGRLTLRCEPTDVGEIVQRVVETRAALAWRASRVEVTADVPPALPAVLADANRVEDALQNLLHNAVRHTEPGGIVAVVVTAECEAVLIQVKDTGEGITPEDLPHIWERFYQAKEVHARMGGGTGLGLALVKEWTEAMGGTVAVESVLGEGSCFSIRLPRAC